ncbi:SNF2 family N-terminal domain-containing protein [Pavlovales sp. CCMP2436]|nr:SNF2 family N-terminal domain-containing protein [Pavlovales sp. CCMP2436]
MAPAPELRTLGDVFTRVGSVAAPLLEPCRAGATFAGIEMEHDVLSLILGQLAARELMALGQTCRALRALAAQVPPPGLRLSLFPHQRASLAWMLRQEGDAPHRSGILADEPGLGKTITVSALLCATAGMWTQPEPCPRALVLARDEREWAALAFTYRRQAVSKVLSLLRCAHPAEFALFAMDGKAAAQELPGYADVVHAAPTDYQCVAKDAAVASYATLASFDAALRAVTDNALSYWSSEIPSQFPAAVDVCAAARALASALDGALATLRGPAAAVARLPSRCTLVVVPRPLLRHWREQLTWHVQRSGEGAPQSEVGGEGGEEEKKGGEEQQRQQGLGLVGEVLFDSFGDDCADAAAERLASAVAAGFANPLASRTAAAIAARELPEGGAARLARASVFVTTAERLAGEERRHGGGSSLLRLQWLRLVVDEGHLISAGSLTFAKQFLHRVRKTERNNEGARQLGALQGIMKALGNWGRSWVNN